jgi:hypothetical protein
MIMFKREDSWIGFFSIKPRFIFVFVHHLLAFCLFILFSYYSTKLFSLFQSFNYVLNESAMNDLLNVNLFVAYMNRRNPNFILHYQLQKYKLRMLFAALQHWKLI